MRPHPREIGFCISAHGMGHATRATALMQQLQHRVPNLGFRIVAAADSALFSESGIVNFTLLQRNVDVGIVQVDSLHLDRERTREALAEAASTRDESLSLLLDFYRGVEAVVADIAPLGIAAAQALGVPAILVENFRWDWIYRRLDPRDPTFAETAAFCERLYAQAALHIQTAPWCEPLTHTTKVGVIARAPRASSAATRKRLGLPQQGTVILLSLAEMTGEELAQQLIGYPPDYHWVIPIRNGQTGRVENRWFVGPEEYHPDLVAAADLVVGKIGYSTIAEVATSGTRFAYYQRAWFPETLPLRSFVETHICSAPLISPLAEASATVINLCTQPRQRALANDAARVGHIVMSFLSDSR